MKKEYLYGILGLLGGALLTLIFATNAVNSNNTGMMGIMGIRNAQNNSYQNSYEIVSDNINRHFIEQMIPHHQLAVMMANMLSQGTNHPETKQLAQNIITAQTEEINQMRQWYSDWGYKQ